MERTHEGRLNAKSCVLFLGVGCATIIKYLKRYMKEEQELYKEQENV